MRTCANCHTEDALIYDITQKCLCVDAGYPIAETVHDAAQHNPRCARLRHTVTPYMKQLRRFRKPDGSPDEFGKLDLPKEFSYLRSNGFTGLVHSGFLWAEKYMCRACVITWEQRQALRRDYEARCAALESGPKPHEYESMICF